MSINLETLAIFGGPIITFAVTFSVMHYRLNQVVSDQKNDRRLIKAVHNFARWYLTDKEKKSLLEINEILGVEVGD